MEKKKWVEFRDGYFVSNYGNVRNKEREFTYGITSNGYCCVTIAKKCYRVHLLVANNFIPKIKGKPYVNHIDNNKSNNKASNLEWVTNKENNSREKKFNRDTRKIPILCVETGQVFNSIMEAARKVKVDESCIRSVVNGYRKTSGGYHWERLWGY